MLNTRCDADVVKQPWYKERIRTQYFKMRSKGEQVQIHRPEQWTFIKTGLDDFNSGLPPESDDVIVKPKHQGIGPAITGQADATKVVPRAKKLKNLTKEEKCFSKVQPQAQARKDRMEKLEQTLKSHPLALYPHLEESVPPELFEEVANILDHLTVPNRAQSGSAQSQSETIRSRGATDTDFDPKESSTSSQYERAAGNQLTEMLQQRYDPRNPYQWLPSKEEMGKVDPSEIEAQGQTEHIRKVVNEFCEWVQDLGGTEGSNIEETTIHSLFASGYETKPALSVPIHVVELSSIPAELRNMASSATTVQMHKKVDEERSEQHKKEPQFKKFRYGAWYLGKEHWKKIDAEVGLQDPRQVKDYEISETKKKSEMLDEELAPLHGSKAFIGFLNRRRARRPEFLDRVADLIKQNEEADEGAIGGGGVEKRTTMGTDEEMLMFS